VIGVKSFPCAVVSGSPCFDGQSDGSIQVPVDDHGAAGHDAAAFDRLQMAEKAEAGINEILKEHTASEIAAARDNFSLQILKAKVADKRMPY
jgi:hypothetical protein